MLSLVVEKAGGKSFGDLLQEEIFDPLGMTETSITDPKKLMPNRAEGYRRNQGTLINVDASDFTSTLGAGGIMSSLTDMVKWKKALLEGTLLSREALQRMWTPSKLNNGSDTIYGYGWFTIPERGHKMIGHTGQMHGFVCEFFWLPEDNDFTIIALSNRYRVNIRQLTRRVTSTFVPSLR